MIKQIIAKWFCLHTWEEKNCIKWIDRIDRTNTFEFIYCCTKCGKFKKIISE